VESLLAAQHPQTPVRILNTGISGNRVTDLQARWQSDVLEHQPDWLAIMIGINDVWRQFDTPDDPAPVTPEIFEATYRALLQSIPPTTQILLATPFLIEADPTDPMRQQMDYYGSIVKTLAGEFDLPCIDTQAAFNAYLQHRPAQSLAEDRVHPNQTGHTILAKAFLDSLGFEWNHRAN
jgi:lysophospholipase L1-like esterase